MAGVKAAFAQQEEPPMAHAAVVVTGAAGDLGGAIAQAYAADGHLVFAADLRPVEPRARVEPVALDVTARDAVFELAARAGDTAGGLGLWINAAGLFVVTPVGDATAEDWDRLIAVNLTGTFHGCAAAFAVMAAAGRGGAIINLGSISGQVGGTAVHPGYGASKAGVHALTKSYALEGARCGIRVNAVAPSVVEGRMAKALAERQRARLVETNPMRRLALVREVVDTVRFLASPAASYLTGVVLPVNGGALMP
jgi:NAD(P)-dependent dehydrogenase (short-subunit alcohol dehydrogenase family)